MFSSCPSISLSSGMKWWVKHLNAGFKKTWQDEKGLGRTNMNERLEILGITSDSDQPHLTTRKPLWHWGWFQEPRVLGSVSKWESSSNSHSFWHPWIHCPKTPSLITVTPLRNCVSYFLKKGSLTHDRKDLRTSCQISLTFGRDVYPGYWKHWRFCCLFHNVSFISCNSFF